MGAIYLRCESRLATYLCAYTRTLRARATRPLFASRGPLSPPTGFLISPTGLVSYWSPAGGTGLVLVDWYCADAAVAVLWLRWQCGCVTVSLTRGRATRHCNLPLTALFVPAPHPYCWQSAAMALWVCYCWHAAVAVLQHTYPLSKLLAHIRTHALVLPRCSRTHAPTARHALTRSSFSSFPLAFPLFLTHSLTHAALTCRAPTHLAPAQLYWPRCPAQPSAGPPRLSPHFVTAPARPQTHVDIHPLPNTSQTLIKHGGRDGAGVPRVQRGVHGGGGARAGDAAM